ncbi:MAG: glycosyltransferase family 1 protein [Armatimonadota bacterium]|nr:glycosyltransferase family 1 protein [Armatimonadota bacterium]
MRHVSSLVGSVAAFLAAAARHGWYSCSPPRTRHTPPLRIGIDVSAAQIPEPSGMGRYIDLLVRALLALNSGDAYTLLCSAGPLRPEWRGAQIRRLSFPVGVFARLLGPPRIQVAAGPVDVFHCQAGFTPRFRYGALVATIHDVIPLVMPDGYDAPYLEALRAHLYNLVSQATLVHTGSQAAARDLEQVLNLSANRIRVVPHGPDPRCARPPGAAERARVREGLGLPGPYLLAVGTVSRHKNHPILVRAFAAIAGEVRQHLIIVGRPGSAWDEVNRLVRQLGMEERVRVLGYVPDHLLPALIAEADLLVQPSLLEGFGLPVLDAMAAGTPVACAKASALPEVGGDAAEYFNPHDAQEMAEVLRRVLNDAARREALRCAGRRQAARFSWEETARRMSEVYREAARLHALG